MLHEGVAASPGVAIGQAFLFQRVDLDVPDYKISESDLDKEIKRFNTALDQTKSELEEIRTQIEKEIPSGYANIFRAHLLFLEDTMFLDAIINDIRLTGNNAELAVKKVALNLIEQLSNVDYDYMRGRADDVRDVARRLIQNLMGNEKMDLSSLKREVIVIARDLSPSDTALMDKKKVIGFATDVGSRTSHTAIMARALEIPAVVGLGRITSRVKTGDLVIIDGVHGKVLINPDSAVVEEYMVEQSKFNEFERSLDVLKELPAVTHDGYGIKLAGNIEVPEELISVIKYGAKGIGLYRTEYLYIRKREMPSEEEQYESYKDAVEKMAPEPVIIRTLDLGGDKFASYLEFDNDVDSMLGLRAIRLCLQRPDIFLPQLRAILRASVYGNLKIMFPMISSVEELRQAKVLLEHAKTELAREGFSYNPELEVGVMIEVPSAAMTADILAKECDFFSIGTNDLIQYTMAVHRVNEEVAYLYVPLNPAILRLIQRVVDAAHDAGIWVGMCGEMAGDPLVVPLLVGMGFDELSMSPASVPEVKKIIRSLHVETAKKMLHTALSFSTAHEVETYVYNMAMEIFPEVIMWIDRRSS